MNLAIGSYIFSAIVLMINIAMFVAIRFNDLKHLTISVKELKDSVEKQSGTIVKLAERISRVEGKLEIQD